MSDESQNQAADDRPQELQDKLDDMQANPSAETQGEPDAPFNPREAQQQDSEGSG